MKLVCLIGPHGWYDLSSSVRNKLNKEFVRIPFRELFRIHYRYDMLIFLKRGSRRN